MLYLTSASLATRSSATISLSRRDRVFFTWINFNSIAFVSLCWTSTATPFSVKPLEFFDHSVLQKHTDKEFIMN